jgi:hypothetical protein
VVVVLVDEGIPWAWVVYDSSKRAVSILILELLEAPTVSVDVDAPEEVELDPAPELLASSPLLRPMLVFIMLNILWPGCMRLRVLEPEVGKPGGG